MRTPAHGRASPDTTEPARGATVLTVLLGLLFGLAASGASAMAVALPALAEDLDLSRSTSAWVLSGYALTLAVTTALHGRIADLVGIRLPLVLGVCVMAAGSIAAALAPSFPVLLGARLAQGAGAAAIPVLATDLLSSRFSGSDRSAALGRLAGVGAAVSSLGPLLGGVLEVAGGWRLTALLPALGLLLIPVVWRAAPSTGERTCLDLRGAVLVAAAGTGLVLLVQSPSAGIVVGAVGSALLVVGGLATTAHVRARPNGFLPRAVIGNRMVTASGLAAASCPAAWFALLTAVPALLTDHGWSPLQIGLGLMPSAIAGVVISRLSGPVLERLGEPRALCVAATIAASALLLAAAAVSLDSVALLLGAVALVTVAFGIGQPALVSAVGASVAPAIRGVALGLATFLILLGAGVGSAALGGLPELLGTVGSLLTLAALPVLGVLTVWRLVLRPIEESSNAERPAPRPT